MIALLFASTPRHRMTRLPRPILFLTRHLLPLAAGLLLAASPVRAAPLVDTAELAPRLDAPTLRIVDIREGKDAAGRSPYEIGHLRGAVSVPYSQWRGPKDNPGKPPEAATLTRLIQGIGADRDTEVVIVYEGRDSSDFGSAARVYWTLKTAGLSRLSILNGGVAAWRAAGQPLVTEVPVVKPSTYVAQIDTRWLATRDDVAKAQAAKSAKLIDARPKAFYEGETRHVAAGAPGTIAGASSLDNAMFFTKGGGSLLAAADVKRVAASKGLEPGAAADSVSFCNTGHWAATNWFVLSEVMGEKNVRMYPESMVEWSKAGLPMDNVPGRLKQLMIDLKLSGS
jgi:thiosulfate/3-mercaptopyruvate sulfurtransferase